MTRQLMSIDTYLSLYARRSLESASVSLSLGRQYGQAFPPGARWDARSKFLPLNPNIHLERTGSRRVSLFSTGPGSDACSSQAPEPAFPTKILEVHPGHRQNRLSHQRRGSQSKRNTDSIVVIGGRALGLEFTQMETRVKGVF